MLPFPLSVSIKNEKQLGTDHGLHEPGRVWYPNLSAGSCLITVPCGTHVR